MGLSSNRISSLFIGLVVGLKKSFLLDILGEHRGEEHPLPWKHRLDYITIA
jgi:hypothetical protein